MQISEIITAASIDVDLLATDKPGIFDRLGLLLARGLPAADPETISRILAERERLATTGVGDGVAIPHGKLPGLERLAAAVAIARDGVHFGAIDGRPVSIFVALLAPPEATADHLKALARISRLLKTPEFRERLTGASSGEDALRIIAQEESRY